jgi:uncharacterized protein (UPF0335 family)
MVDVTKDNTAVNELRARMQLTASAFKERMLRDINRLYEEVADLDTEIQEGMSNRVGDGFQSNEARKYAARLRANVLRDTAKDLEGIQADLATAISGLVGEKYALGESDTVGGLIGNATPKNYEMSELAIQVMTPPGPVPPA